MHDQRHADHRAIVRENEPEGKGAGGGFFSTRLARMIPEGRREAFETEARRGFSQVRPTQAYLESVEGPNEKSPAGREDRTAEQAVRNLPG